MNDHVMFRLLEKFKVFTAFYHLNELRSREDLIKGIIENLDYSMYAFIFSVFFDYFLSSLPHYTATVIRALSCPRHLRQATR